MVHRDLPVLLGGTPLLHAPFVSLPLATGDEIRELEKVLETSVWMDGQATQAFEEELAAYLGVPHVVAVNTGGMALQIALRVLGLLPGDEVVIPVDTCVADAFAVLNAGAVPLFADSDPETCALDWASVEETIGPQTRAVVVVHPWGRPADMDHARRLADRHGLYLIDDACQALGAEWRGRKVGTLGDVGVYSFGWMKPLQAGGGGAIVTHDDSLARAMRASRAWGDREAVYGEFDCRDLAWNGRIPEVVAAVLRVQLRAYPQRLASIQDMARRLEARLSTFPGVKAMPPDARVTAEGRSKLLLTIDSQQLGFSLDTLAKALDAEGLPDVWHATFHPLPELGFFAEGRWRLWAAAHTDHDRIAHNYARSYLGADRIYNETGLSLGRQVLVSGNEALDDVVAVFARICAHRDSLAVWEGRNSH